MTAGRSGYGLPVAFVKSALPAMKPGETPPFVRAVSRFEVKFNDQLLRDWVGLLLLRKSVICSCHAPLIMGSPLFGFRSVGRCPRSPKKVDSPKSGRKMP